MKTLVWFRSDLRLEDNPALKNAFIESDEIHAVFIYSKVQLKRHNESNIKIDFLIRNLNSLEQSLASLNIPLILSYMSMVQSEKLKVPLVILLIMR